MNRLEELLVILMFIFAHDVASLPVSKEATDKAAKAFYYQMHWDQDVNMITHWAESKFTKDQIKYGGYAYIVVRIVLDQEIHYTWHFP